MIFGYFLIFPRFLFLSHIRINFLSESKHHFLSGERSAVWVPSGEFDYFISFVKMLTTPWKNHPKNVIFFRQIDCECPKDMKTYLAGWIFDCLYIEIQIQILVQIQIEIQISIPGVVTPLAAGQVCTFWSPTDGCCWVIFPILYTIPLKYIEIQI